MIKRFSSRRRKLGSSFLAERLNGAKSYDRIAGYFSSSILEVAGEQIESMTGVVRVVCNSELDPDDVRSARAAQTAIRQEWCASDPIRDLESKGRERFVRLRDFLHSGKLQVKVLPSHRFGLIHGKAGVITQGDGSKTAFMGSANETVSGWALNYELVWEDDSDDAVKWVEEEFGALWKCHEAFPLAEAVVEDIERLVRRTVIPGTPDWREKRHPEAASPIIETPVYRKEYGLWSHQKYFVQRAFDAHRGPYGAQFVLADMVGLGKTLQLAMSAMLMALWGSRPVLIIVPKPLLWQWQDELLQMLDMPSAVWDGKQWVDEREIVYPSSGQQDILNCPRKVGIISQGLIVRGSEAARRLLEREYECVILDEGHRARRNNRRPDEVGDAPDPNNLLKFLYDISPRTKSMLIATATPVQLHPVEAWDLLNALATGNDHVLGNTLSSRWRKPDKCLPVVTGEQSLPESEEEIWDWVRNPLPPVGENRQVDQIRRSLNVPEDKPVVEGKSYEELRPPDLQRLRELRRNYGRENNPFIRHIIRRTRDFLETEINPETNLPFLDKVEVILLGEQDDEAIRLTDYLAQAYEVAGEFCKLVSARSQGAGFLETLLLKRVGSTIAAGLNTARRMLENWASVDEDEDGEESRSEMKTLSPEEQDLLERFIGILEKNEARDPKYAVVARLLKDGHPLTGPEPWLDCGCIIFTQYFESAQWLATELSQGDFPEEPIGLYAGAGKSAIYTGGVRQSEERETIKKKVRQGELRLVIGTEAASEGLNLQRLGTLINLDLPWNPTRLEQRKGRIQRIGQKRDKVFIYNMRYKGSVEDRVHDILSSRLKDIHGMFGQIPDTLEDVWIHLALGENEKAQQKVGEVPKKHPFEAKYNQIEQLDWESCAEVLNAVEKRNELTKGW